jgi:hypothetical protein
MAEDLYIVEADGSVINKAQQIDNLSSMEIAVYVMQDEHAVVIGKDATLLRYKVSVTGTVDGEGVTPHWSLVSTIWVRRNGRFQQLLYQETYCAK